MVGETEILWSKLLDTCAPVTLPESEDKLSWILDKSGVYSVKSIYSAMQVGCKVPYKFLWKVKIPPRIRTFIWLVLRKSILTRDVLLHRGESVSLNVCFVDKKKRLIICSLNVPLQDIFGVCGEM